MDYAKEVRTLINTGKFIMGARKVLKELSVAKPQGILVSANIPEQTRARINHYCRLNGVKLITMPFSSVELGSVCGRAHVISSIAVLGQGDSKILKG